MPKPICPKCLKPVDTREGYAKGTGKGTPKDGPGTYHFDCYILAMGVPTTYREN